MSSLRQLALLAAPLALAACAKGPLLPPEITSERTDAGSTELTFLLDDRQSDPDGGLQFSMRGMQGGDRVGFGVQLGPWSESAPDEQGAPTWRCEAQLVSRGTESDELLQFIDRLYRAQVPAHRMEKSIECTAVAAGQDPGKLELEDVKLLLTFPADRAEAGEAEVWLEVLPAQARVIWRERDPSFRRALIQALVEHPR